MELGKKWLKLSDILSKFSLEFSEQSEVDQESGTLRNSIVYVNDTIHLSLVGREDEIRSYYVDYDSYLCHSLGPVSDSILKNYIKQLFGSSLLSYGTLNLSLDLR